MKPILMMEGNGAESRARAGALGMATSSEIYAQAVRRCDADVAIEFVYAADPGSGKVRSMGIDVVFVTAFDAHEDAAFVERNYTQAERKLIVEFLIFKK